MRAREERPGADRGAQENGSEQTDVSSATLPRPGDVWLYRTPRAPGCPAGCELDSHQCGVGEPLGDEVDYDDSAVWWSGRLTSVGAMWAARRAS